VVIPSSGSYQVSFTAASGSGLTATAQTASVTVVGTGLAVSDNQRYSDGTGVVSGRWNYVGGTPTSYRYRWQRVSDGAVLADWATGDATNSSVLSLSGTGVSLQTGDAVSLEVQALDGQGGVLDDRSSPGALVDTTAPAMALGATPAFAAPTDLWAQFTAQDQDSGLSGATILAKKSTGSGWTVVAQKTLAAPGSSIQRIDWDLSGSGLTTGDRVVLEISTQNGAGLTSTVESGVILVDAAPPPAPTVVALVITPSGTAVPISTAVNPIQKLGLDWSYSTPDSVSGTTYLYKVYSAAADPSSVAWTPAGSQTSAIGLDESSLPDGTVLYFAVKAVNGAGLETVSVSPGVVLDTQAPTVNALDLYYGGSTAITNSFVRQSDLGSAPQFFGIFGAVDAIAGLSGFQLQWGTWTPQTGFVPLGAQQSFPAASAAETSQASPAVSLNVSPGVIYMAQGVAYNNAGNATVYTSPMFEVAGNPPQVAGLTGNQGPNSISFTWTTDQNPLPADFIGYQVSLNEYDTATQAFDIPLAASSTASLQSAAAWSADWNALGLHKGDQVRFVVTPVTLLGQGAGQAATLTLAPDLPALNTLDYTRYFSTHFNVRQVAYSAPAGIEQISWKVLDGTTGQIVQDWTGDYSGNSTAWTNAYPAALGITDGQRLILELRAESESGVWSTVTPTQTILVDETSAVGVTVTRPSAYSNAAGNTGVIDGWTLTAEDDQSGVTSYQTLLSTSPNATVLDWSQAAPETAVSGAPGAAWHVAVSIPGVSAQTDYYAFLRVRNGTGDWGPTAVGSVVHVSWTAPVIAMSFDSSVAAARDSSGAAVTNSASETLTVTSNEPGTSFVLAVNGAAYPNQPSSQDGSPAGASGVQSWGQVSLAAPGTDALTLTATDRYGNQAVVSDLLRFNQAAQIYALRSATTPGHTVTLEQMVNVSDDARDYPLSYSWNLGGGTAVSSPASSTASSSAPNGVVEWLPGGLTTAQYYQQTPRAQVSHYTATLTVTDAWGLVTTFPLDIAVGNTTSGILYTNEYWTGPVSLTGMVEIPSGLSLTLDGAVVQVQGPPDSGGIMQGGIQVDAGATLSVANTSASSLFDTASAGYFWKGILVAGAVSGAGLELDHAERGFALSPTGSINLSSLALKNNLIGAQLYGGSFTLTSGDIESNSEYGIKEDTLGTYSILNTVFLGNAVDYYRWTVTGISPAELNALPGNGGNR
jgi:hypothetical protein